MNNFYDDIDLKYHEIVKSVKICYPGERIKLHVSILMPGLDSDKDIDKKIQKQSTSNIVTKFDSPTDSVLGITSFYTHNYIEIDVPEHIRSQFYQGIIPKDTRFIVVFISGDINKIRIIDKY